MSADDLQAIAWRDFLSWASTDSGMRAAFTRDTGLRFGAETMAEFVLWATKTQYGLEYAPAAYREAVR